MGKFTFYLDQRGKKDKKDDYQYPLCVRANIKNDTIYLQIKQKKGAAEYVKLTKQQFDTVFNKQSLDAASIDFRDKCRTHITRCEKILSSLGDNYNRTEFVKLYKSDGEIVEDQPFNSLVLTDICDYFIKNNSGRSSKYKSHIRTSVNVFNTYQPELTILDITPSFLEGLKNSKEGVVSPATVQSYNRNIRKLINYATNTLKIVPATFQYPYGNGGYTIGSYFPTKMVMRADEIKR